MPQQENEEAERIPLDVEEEETLRIAEKRSAHSPYFDNVHGQQEPAELAKVRDWATALGECGHSISGIEPNLDEGGNRDDPPDVLAEMDGKLVGIEVTDLMKYQKGHELCILTFNGRLFRVSCGM